MALSHKRAVVTGDPIIDRALSDVYRDINELINAVNSGDTNRVKTENSGKSGDIRVVKDSDNNYSLEVKADDGWTTIDATFKGATTTPDWTVTNKTGTSRALDANGSLEDIGDRVAQLVDDLISMRLLQ